MGFTNGRQPATAPAAPPVAEVSSRAAWLAFTKYDALIAQQMIDRMLTWDCRLRWLMWWIHTRDTAEVAEARNTTAAFFSIFLAGFETLLFYCIRQEQINHIQVDESFCDDVPKPTDLVKQSCNEFSCPARYVAVIRCIRRHIFTNSWNAALYDSVLH